MGLPYGKYVREMLRASHRTILSDGFIAFVRKVGRKITRGISFNRARLALNRRSRRAVAGDERSWRDDYAYLKQELSRVKRGGDAADRKRRDIDLIEVSQNRLAEEMQNVSLPEAVRPAVSVVIPVFNNIKFTVECLLSIVKHTDNLSEIELIVIDDGSRDETELLLRRVENLVYVRNDKNLGFLKSSNRGAKQARGEYLVFLNNDTQVTENWLPPLLTTFETQGSVGLVGPKVLYPDGTLQEAGAIINRDCTTEMIGIGENPDAPRYNYLREVDYCSGVCLAVRSDVFRELGGFDESFAPAYCEDVDLAIRFRARGLRTLYNPQSAIVHHLSMTSDRVEDGQYKTRHVVRNQQQLSEKWQEHIDDLNRIRAIAFYLPQFHPIPENDRWWGKGFTEWTNVAKARPNFQGHYQPRLPADLGFYDLRVESVIAEQAELAKRYGIHGFCYYYYRFGNKRLLEMPLERLLERNIPDIPFCICWANENWTRRWDGAESQILMEQQYSDDSDRQFIRDVIQYFKHPNYIRVHGKPLLLIYRVGLFPDIRKSTSLWREVCLAEGMGEIYLAMVESFQHSVNPDTPSELGFDASVEFPPHGVWGKIGSPGRMVNPDFSGDIYDYREVALKYLERESPGYVRFRGVMPAWDNTARRQNDSHIFAFATPGSYQAWLEAIIEQTRRQNHGDERIIFVNSWNEWAECANLEPCREFGHGFLDATRNALAYSESVTDRLEREFLRK